MNFVAIQPLFSSVNQTNISAGCLKPTIQSFEPGDKIKHCKLLDGFRINLKTMRWILPRLQLHWLSEEEQDEDESESLTEHIEHWGSMSQKLTGMFVQTLMGCKRQMTEQRKSAPEECGFAFALMFLLVLKKRGGKRPQAFQRAMFWESLNTSYLEPKKKIRLGPPIGQPMPLNSLKSSVLWKLEDELEDEDDSSRAGGGDMAVLQYS